MEKNAKIVKKIINAISPFFCKQLFTLRRIKQTNRHLQQTIPKNEKRRVIKNLLFWLEGEYIKMYVYQKHKEIGGLLWQTQNQQLIITT